MGKLVLICLRSCWAIGSGMAPHLANPNGNRNAMSTDAKGI
jgi:hypothetical protein